VMVPMLLPTTKPSRLVSSSWPALCHAQQ
jgi:hypothetical protein